MKVLFVCVENAGRSQMAMREKGIDVSSKTPKMLTAEMIEAANLVVTMGCSVEEVAQMMINGDTPSGLLCPIRVLSVYCPAGLGWLSL
jgi:protein-tyrosine-phosphatase